ncbi:MAG: MBL fold metallo-hydrolase [Pseudomonadota bacterium]|nr:MBL fold metallo-hydrolase [Pseudomonadota bacterium]
MKLAGIDVEAVSVGGLETCIELPAFDIAFDIGRCPMSAVKRPRVLFTHAHMDHMGGIAYHAATRDLVGMKPPTYFVPRENYEDVLGLLDAWRRLDRSTLPCNVHACGPGDRVDIGGGRIAEPFRSPHRVPCQGYAIVSTRKKLRADLVGLPPQELQRRRLAGEVVSEDHEVVDVAFTGDTVIDVVDREEKVRTARLLILEVTFLDERVPVDKARSKGHVHLDEVIERAALFQNEALLFTHFSARYSADQIVRILDARLPPGLRERVTPLLPASTPDRMR